ncbi:hypothetical protein POSPLADRAFT_1044997 [Postia placenta MAD-698-R-SB12]|uniref:Uncharacterized protein n=1 Tax=Postia placenta MAD-698-R-SB12 TaxID=670580 RepID=A0A1X6N5B8_9APHY|nr:hypothetical protein POSPLADRAFT_1044997 [Postia placenta MAD-698-R-SB12]OSX63804.1 hypothetical protein POSPLADRAFT_1044997 [Postia placenta MAD-698-R-SB12]
MNRFCHFVSDLAVGASLRVGGGSPSTLTGALCETRRCASRAHRKDGSALAPKAPQFGEKHEIASVSTTHISYEAVSSAERWAERHERRVDAGNLDFASTIGPSCIPVHRPPREPAFLGGAGYPTRTSARKTGSSQHGQNMGQHEMRGSRSVDGARATSTQGLRTDRRPEMFYDRVHRAASGNRAVGFPASRTTAILRTTEDMTPRRALARKKRLCIARRPWCPVKLMRPPAVICADAFGIGSLRLGARRTFPYACMSMPEGTRSRQFSTQVGLNSAYELDPRIKSHRGRGPGSQLAALMAGNGREPVGLRVGEAAAHLDGVRRWMAGDGPRTEGTAEGNMDVCGCFDFPPAHDATFHVAGAPGLARTKGSLRSPCRYSHAHACHTRVVFQRPNQQKWGPNAQRRLTP